MKPSFEEKETCTHCNTEMHIRRIDHEQLDITIRSLLIMFRIAEYKVVECPCCHTRRLFA